MSKSSKFIWLNSFAADEDAPKCPKDLPEPAWAQLLYDPYCQVCFVPPAPVTRKLGPQAPHFGCRTVILRELRKYTGSHIADCAKNASRRCKL